MGYDVIGRWQSLAPRGTAALLAVRLPDTVERRHQRRNRRMKMSDAARRRSNWEAKYNTERVKETLDARRADMAAR
jgi:hypothetical protein